MRHSILLAVLLCVLCPPLVATAQPAAPAFIEPVQVLVLGTYHFGNPGLDIHNVQADDVLQPHRQRELQALVQRLLDFKPTKVMIERQPDTADLTVPDYRDFQTARLGRDRDETVQIGYRLAHAAGLAQVHGIDEQPAAGEPDYFPFQKVQQSAQEHGQESVIAQAMAGMQAEVEAFGKRQSTSTIAQLLASANGAEAMTMHRRGYYGILGIGDNDQQAGADLNAMWYLRNAKIFAKLMHIAEPGDRIVVVYGAGHAYWLRHFASETPGYAMIDPLRYLQP